MSTLLEQASLIMIPSGYKEDVVYSVIPETGAGDLSFTRASNGTRINSAGLVEVTPWNLAQYSEDFSNAYWTKNNIPVMAYNVAIAPNGTMTADSIQSDSSSVYQSVSATTITVAPNSTVTLSIYIKKETSKTYFTGSYLYFTGGTTKLTYVLFDEVNGSINIIAPDEVSMVTSVESVGNWWRFIVTGTDTGNNTNLDFAFYGTLSQNGTSLNPGIGSVRTIWGAQVNIGSTAKPYFPTTDRLNVPRLTYQNGGGGCPSLLLEKQSTNLQRYSEDVTNATYWSLGNITATANTTTSPDGTINADSIIETTANARHELYSESISFSGSNAVSFFIKANGRQYISVLSGGDPSFGGVTYDVVNGVITSTQGTTATISAMGNGWYKCTFTTTRTGTSQIYWCFRTTGGSPGVETYTGNGTSGFFIWGAQIEASSYPTSYIPTTSASATRVADSCFKTGISSLFGTNQGTFFMDFLFNNTGLYDYLFDVTDSSNTQRFLMYDDNGSGLFVLYDTQNIVNFTMQLTQGQRYKIGVKYNSSGTIWYVNGILKATGTASFAYQMSQIYLGQRFSIEDQTQIQVNQTIVFPTALSGTDLIALTTI
jgi:hypothetical protein